MAKLTPSWDDTKLPESKNPAGYAGNELDVHFLAAPLSEVVAGDHKPVVVYFYSPEDKKEMDRIQEAIFKVENVGASLRAFKLFKLDVTRIDRDDLKKEYAKNTPKFLFMDGDGKAIVNLDHAITTPNFLSAMKKTFAAAYSASYDEFIRAHRALLDRVDAVNSKKALIAAKREQLKTRSRSDKTVELEKEFAKDDVALTAEEEKIAADEARLFKSLKARKDLVSKN